MKQIGLFLLLILQLVGSLYAQNVFKPGYVIKEAGDTIFGEIDYRGDLLMSRTCRFRVSKNDDENEYSPYDIQAFRFIDGKYFVSRQLKDKKVFLEFLIKGQVDIYYLRDDGDHYYIQKDGYPLTEIPYEKKKVIIGDDGHKYFLEMDKHIHVLKMYMGDTPEIQSKIDDIRVPDHKNLIKLGEDYHNQTCEGEECIIYEKKMPAMSINLEILGGYMNRKPTDEREGDNYFQGGILMHLCLPRLSEKLYLRMGLLNETDEYDDFMVRMPIQLEYIYPKSKIRPKVAVGVSLFGMPLPPIFWVYSTSISFMGGVNIILYKSINLSLNYDIDIVRSGVRSHSILGGIYIDF